MRLFNHSKIKLRLQLVELAKQIECLEDTLGTLKAKVDVLEISFLEIANSKNDVVGEYYLPSIIKTDEIVNCTNDWVKFKSKDIRDEFQENIKINSYWFKKKDVFFYSSYGAEEKKRVEEKYNGKE